MNRTNRLFSLFFAISANGILFAQHAELPLKLSKAKLITTPKEGAQYVFNSPDGKYIAYSSQDLNKLFVRNTTDKKATTRLAYEGDNVGYFPQWASDSKNLFFRAKNKKESATRFQSIVYSVESNVAVERVFPFKNDISTSSVFKTNTGYYVYINNKLMLEAYNETTKQTIVFEGTESCYQVVISPLGDKIAVHVGPNIWVYSLNQQTTPINLGEGLVTSWSPNGKFLLGFKEERKDGHQMGNTDVYAFDISSQKSIQLSFTKKSQEINPTWSFDGKAVYYIDFKTGGIYFSKVKFK